MNEFMKDMTGMGGMTEQVIATDFLMAAKSGIKNYALALTECYTPELRQALTEQLNDAIRTHEQITNYMVNKGYYHPIHVKEQLNLDLQAAQTAMGLSPSQSQSQSQSQIQ
ncbi:spore coat protein [Bacillus dakarensis]|uniref:spore coat protein n=1 Tax=Robertmurraya dakarensis TaxID=1926278 RepID=UPI000980F55D|nr:spore coat protein [Bacillus dakarensis]